MNGHSLAVEVAESQPYVDRWWWADPGDFPVATIARGKIEARSQMIDLDALWKGVVRAGLETNVDGDSRAEVPSSKGGSRTKIGFDDFANDLSGSSLESLLSQKQIGDNDVDGGNCAEHDGGNRGETASVRIQPVNEVREGH